MFVNAVGGDFRVQSSSPAIDKGTNVGFSSDYIGTTLPTGSGYDIGAYEYLGITVPKSPQNIQVVLFQ
jgi:hypothetical protein